jgi:hypothetical protein
MTLVGSRRPLVGDAPLPPSEVLFKEARTRRRRRRLGWLVVVVGACMALLISLLVGEGGGSRVQRTHRSALSSAVPAGTPALIVGWTSNEQLVVISTSTGRTVRTLASNISIFAPGLPDISVSPDGQVFFDSDPISGVAPPGAEGDQIFSVPITGGPLRYVAAGSYPQVSPDGAQLAYVASNGTGEAPYLVAETGIDVGTVVGGGVMDVRTLHPGSNLVNQGASDLSWSADSKDLSFNLINGSTNLTTSWAIVLDAAEGSLASARQIPLRPDVSWFGYWNADPETGQLGLGVQTAAPVDPPMAGEQAIVAIDPSTGHPVRRLFEVPAAVCSNSVPSDCTADFVSPLSVDAVGTGVLVAGVIPLFTGVVRTSGTTYLYRWNAGESKPVRLTRNVLVATWGP